MGTLHRFFMIRGVVGSVAAVLFIVAMPSARADEPSLPVLWQGIVQSPDGGAASGTEVVAYARPPADRLREGTNSLVPIARATTDSQGRYVLRSGRSEALKGAEDGLGWVTVMVSAMGPDGVTMAIDTVAWQPTSGTRADSDRKGGDAAGRWLTTVAEQIGASRTAGTYRAASDAGDPGAVADERPAVMVLSGRDADAEPRFSALATPPPMRTHGMCAGPYKVENLDKNTVQVGELHLNSRWSGQFKYWQAKTTSIQVGVRPAGRGWSAGGSVSSLKGDSLSHENPILAENHMYTYRAEMIFKRFTWNCSRADQWHWVDTVEPVEWTGGMERTDFGSAPPCNPKYQIPVVPNDTIRRKKGASTTMAGGFAVAGFVGSATASIADGVEQTWINDLPVQRYLCGERAFPTGHTRVQTLA